MDLIVEISMQNPIYFDFYIFIRKQIFVIIIAIFSAYPDAIVISAAIIFVDLVFAAPAASAEIIVFASQVITATAQVFAYITAVSF